MSAKIIIKDETNAVIKGLDPGTLERVQERLTFYVPGFVHMPAYKLGRWDGKIRLFKQSGATYVNLLEYIIDLMANAGYEFEFEDYRQEYPEITEKLKFIDESFLNAYELDGKPLTLWEHQVAAVNKCVEFGSGVLELATGSGKTAITGILAKLFEPFGRVVIIVPNIDLVLQTQQWYKNIGIDAGIWYNEIKDRKQTTIATWQSLDNFPELFADVICVIVDEVHQAKAKVLNEMLTGPAADVPFRFGCSGTIPKEDLFRFQIEAAIGKVIFQLGSWELQEKGVLARSQVFQVVLCDSQNPQYKKLSPTHEEWSDELNWMFSDKARLRYIADTIRQVANEYGNTIVLVQYRKHGKALAELLPEAVSLDGRDKKRDVHYKRFNESENEILICTFGIASTGIDIPRIHNLVILEPGKKFEKVIQTMGRGLRKADDKEYLNVFDICGDDGFSKHHARHRKSLYREAKHPYEIIEAEYHNVDSDS